ncbi:ABC transporter substrate-binding protein [Arhodomonas aquaeolei]|uniref:ABC transporter substrate-binding protein n=1 Tax=Arhodomonas aquaeolei TaxID=2369 RepID=UPI0003A5BAF4|nr:ABC transporter substrate-binding protein [Arhodomonas aquaeolei]
MPLSSLRRGTILLVVVFVVSACARDDPPALRLAINPWPGYGFFYIAQQQGFTADVGVDLEIVDTMSLRDSRLAFERGQVNLIGATPLELVQIARRADREARAVLVLDHSMSGDVILARPPVSAVRDLRGRDVAVEPGSVNLLVLASALEKAGVPASDVRLAPMPQSAMPDALADGEVSAAVTYPPFSDRMERLPEVRRIFDTTESPDTVVDVLVASKAIIRQRPDALRRLMRAYQRALDWARANPAAATELLARRSSQNSNEIRRALERIRMIGLREQRDYWGENGHLTGAVRRSIAALEAFDGRSIDLDPEYLLDGRALKKATGR